MQVTINISDLANGDAVDADVMRALLQKLATAINYIDGEQLQAGSVGSEQIGTGVVKVKHLFTDMAARSVMPNPTGNATFLDFTKTTNFKIKGSDNNADDWYALKSGSAHDYIVSVQPEVNCWALLSARVRIKVTNLDPDERSNVEQKVVYLTAGIHNINNTVGHADYGKVVSYGLDLESDLINSDALNRQFDITGIIPLNAGDSYNFATMFKAQTTADADYLLGSVYLPARWTSMGCVLFPRV
jgi:hypothetical protein